MTKVRRNLGIFAQFTPHHRHIFKTPGNEKPGRERPDHDYFLAEWKGNEDQPFENSG